MKIHLRKPIKGNTDLPATRAAEQAINTLYRQFDDLSPRLRSEIRATFLRAYVPGGSGTIQASIGQNLIEVTHHGDVDWTFLLYVRLA